MKRSSRTLTIGSIFVGLAVASGCTPSNKVTPGAPRLVSFTVFDPTGAPVPLVTEAGATMVPPLSTFVAVFDRLLDPTPLVDVDAGVLTAKEGVAIVGTDSGPLAGVDTLYIPNGDHKFTLIYPPGPSITVSTATGLPSGSPVTVSLDPTKVRSKDQTKAFVVADAGIEATLMFDTEPLSAVVTAPPLEVPMPDGGVDANDGDAGADAGADAGTDAGAVTPPGPPLVDSMATLKVTFNNFTTPGTAAAITVSATVAGVTTVLMSDVAPDTSGPVAGPPTMLNAVNWLVPPPATGWPVGATLTVTVGTGVTDTHQKPLGAAVVETFMVAQ